MTIFTVTDIPAAINTVEKLECWCCTILNDLYPNVTAIEASGVAARVVTSAPYYIAVDEPPTWRIINRTSIPLAPTWRRAGKIWTYAQDLGSLAIPTEYKS